MFAEIADITKSAQMVENADFIGTTKSVEIADIADIAKAAQMVENPILLYSRDCRLRRDRRDRRSYRDY